MILHERTFAFLSDFIRNDDETANECLFNCFYCTHFFFKNVIIFISNKMDYP